VRGIVQINKIILFDIQNLEKKTYFCLNKKINMLATYFYRTSLFFFIFLFVGILYINAQAPEWNETDNLPRWITEEEKTRLHEIGKDFTATEAPSGPRNIAEFERMQGVLIRFPLGIPLNLVAAMSEHVTVYTIVANNNTRNNAISAFTQAGVNLENVDFIMAPTNSIWTRDYGPWFAATEDRKIEVVDFIYNRPRQNDNAIPARVADHLNTGLWAMNLIHCGGNYMADSYRIAASTDLVIEENGYNQDMVEDKTYDFLGINDYIITEDAQGDYIRHIDTWAKFLDVNKILIIQVPESNPRYPIYEYIAEYYSEQISAYGTAFQVIRVSSPNGQPYANSLILNERVYVPVSGNEVHDNNALEVYRNAMPGYEVLGFTGQWFSTDALHCRVKEIADIEMLHIAHIPVASKVDILESIDLDVDIISYGGNDVNADESWLYYSKNHEEYDSLPIRHISDDRFQVTLPLYYGDTLVHYYFKAADTGGKIENWPLVGKAAAKSFRINYSPDFLLEPETIKLSTDEPVELYIQNLTPIAQQIDSFSVSQNLDFSWFILTDGIEFPLKITSGASFPILVALPEDFNPEVGLYQDSIFTYSGGERFGAELVYESQTSSVSFVGEDSGDMIVFPNPFQEYIYVKIGKQDLQIMEIQLYDINGNLIISYPFHRAISANEEVNLVVPSSLPSGNYPLQINTKNGSESRMMMKVEE
jgi:agmatine deiminase